MGDGPLEERLRRLLDDVRRRAGTDFAGIGVIVTSDPGSLPLAPLRPGHHGFGDRSVVDVLTGVSMRDSDLHDGFHVLDGSLRLELVSQYFAPPIGPAGPPPPSSGGARWMAALLGSRLPAVLATGLATPDRHPTVFRDGAEVLPTP